MRSRLEKLLTEDYLFIIRRSNIIYNLVAVVAVIAALSLLGEVCISERETIVLAAFFLIYNVMYVINDLFVFEEVGDHRREVPSSKYFYLLSAATFILCFLYIAIVAPRVLTYVLLTVFVFFIHNIFRDVRFVTFPILQFFKYLTISIIFLIEEGMRIELYFIGALLVLSGWRSKHYKYTFFGKKVELSSLTLMIIGIFLGMSNITCFVKALAAMYFVNLVGKYAKL